LNVTENPFPSLENVSGNELTFHNDETTKLDWVVGKKITKVDHRVTAIDASQCLRPNAIEGSDHTPVFVTVSFS
jgi:hypothetical protein